MSKWPTGKVRLGSLLRWSRGRQRLTTLINKVSSQQTFRAMVVIGWLTTAAVRYVPAGVDLDWKKYSPQKANENYASWSDQWSDIYAVIEWNDTNWKLQPEPWKTQEKIPYTKIVVVAVRRLGKIMQDSRECQGQTRTPPEVARGRDVGSKRLATCIAEYKKHWTKSCEKKLQAVNVRKFIQHFWFLLFVTCMLFPICTRCSSDNSTITNY